MRACVCVCVWVCVCVCVWVVVRVSVCLAVRLSVVGHYSPSLRFSGFPTADPVEPRADPRGPKQHGP